MTGSVRDEHAAIVAQLREVADRQYTSIVDLVRFARVVDPDNDDLHYSALMGMLEKRWDPGTMSSIIMHLALREAQKPL